MSRLAPLLLLLLPAPLSAELYSSNNYQQQYSVATTSPDLYAFPQQFNSFTAAPSTDTLQTFSQYQPQSNFVYQPAQQSFVAQPQAQPQQPSYSFSSYSQQPFPYTPYSPPTYQSQVQQPPQPAQPVASVYPNPSYQTQSQSAVNPYAQTFAGTFASKFNELLAQQQHQTTTTETPTPAPQPAIAQIDQENLQKYSQYLEILQKHYGIRLPGELTAQQTLSPVSSGLQPQPVQSPQPASLPPYSQPQQPSVYSSVAQPQSPHIQLPPSSMQPPLPSSVQYPQPAPQPQLPPMPQPQPPPPPPPQQLVYPPAPQYPSPSPSYPQYPQPPQESQGAYPPRPSAPATSVPGYLPGVPAPASPQPAPAPLAPTAPVQQSIVNYNQYPHTYHNVVSVPQEPYRPIEPLPKTQATFQPEYGNTIEMVTAPTEPETRPPTRVTAPPSPPPSTTATQRPSAPRVSSGNQATGERSATTVQALTQQIRRLPAVLYIDSRQPGSKKTEQLLREMYGLPLVAFYVDKIDGASAVAKHLEQLTAHKGLPYLFICGTFIGSDQHIDNYHKNGQIPQLVEYVCGDEKKKLLTAKGKKTKTTST